MTDAIERMVDGVTVRKSFETDEFPVPAVTFDIESAREDPVRVTITDDIPEQVAMEQIGFHPDYHNDEWTAYPEGRVEFTHEFGSRESITTIYGVRLDEDDSQEAFLQDPDISIQRVEDDTAAAVVDQGETGGLDDGGEDVSVTDPDRTNVVREVIEGDRETVPGLEDEETDTAVAEANGGDPAEAGVQGETGTAEEASTSATDMEGEFGDADTSAEATIDDTDPVVADTGGDTSAEDTTAAGARPATGESLAATLAAEIRAGDVDDDDLATIKEELRSDKSTETRIGHLQSRVSDLEAYSQAIEEFIDEHGSAQQLLRSVEDDLTTLANRVDELETSTEEAAAARQELSEDVAKVDAQMETLQADIDEVVGDVGRLQDELDAVRGDVAEVDEEVAAVRADVEERLEETVDDLEDDLESVQEDVEDLHEWRAQLTDVFGAGGGED